MTFEELGLSDPILRAVTELGFKEPMPIQAAAIPVLKECERDFVGLAQTGTGKTCAFGLPMLEQINLDDMTTQGVVICPTRELCLQITNDLQSFAKYMPKLNIVAVYGGASIVNQMKLLRKGAHIIVATPGRLMDLMDRKSARLDHVACVTLDEADEMLNMGFQEDIDKILSSVPERRSIWLFSATMPRGVAQIAKKYLKDPEEVTVGSPNQSAANIEHIYHMVHEKHRYQALKRTLDFAPEIYGLVFCRTRSETQTVAEALMQDGYKAEAIHGDLSQSQRDYVMRKFRQGTVKVLVATDVAARGLDVDDLTHVIHYRLPDEAAVYTHRSGRTARAGKSGYSVSLINMREVRRIKDIERLAKIKIRKEAIPDGRAICEKQLLALVDGVVKTEVNTDDIAAYLPAVMEALGGLDREELIMRFLSEEFNRFLEYYKHSADINVVKGDRDSYARDDRRDRGRRDRPDRNERGVRRNDRSDRLNGSKGLRGGGTRLCVSVGRSDEINKGAIVRMVCETAGVPSKSIGGIEIFENESTFDIETDMVEHVVDAIRSKNARIDGRHVTVSLARGGSDRRPVRRSDAGRSRNKYPRSKD
ncbi:MAG: DEAD/DEAH box helicase [Spartobacteria bacterium]|nr:DEAD/DEAH box helicase [Spartobacteria bacterium]